MKRIILFFIVAFCMFNAYGQYRLSRPHYITEDVVNRLNTLYLSEHYKECIDSCKYYLGYNYYSVGHENRPYKNWNKNHLFDGNGVSNVAVVAYLGCVSSYNYSLLEFDTESIFEGMRWAKTCVAIYEDYLRDNIPNEFWSVDMMAEYITFGERGLTAAQCGQHLLSVLGSEDKWGKKEDKWFENKLEKIYTSLSKNLIDKEDNYSDYPVIQYKISWICTGHAIQKNIFTNYKDIFSKRFDALKKLIQNNSNNIFDSEIHIALNQLTSMLTNSVIESKICKEIGGNYERFCMENLIKLQDLNYYLSGSSRYPEFPNYSLNDIQNRLKDSDCAIMHFEAPVASDHHYWRYDLGTKYRNYAFVITKDQIIPDVWHRGYILKDSVNNLDRVKETYPNAKRFFYVGTPRMSFIDIAGNDSSIVRLHSLSQLMKGYENESMANEVTFIGDIYYRKIGNLALFSQEEERDLNYSERKGGSFEQLKGPALELKKIEAINKWEIRVFRGDNATRSIVASEISRSKDIVHISTHGEQLNFNTDDYTATDLILKKNVLDNSRLILSGYNDDPNSPMTFISGSDILKIKKTNSSLVFLDACSSGRGSVGVSGSVGIAEAFHLIGAKNIICYLEPIDDVIATKFSDSFYIELSKGKSCHDAFFSAKNSIKSKINVVLWE